MDFSKIQLMTTKSSCSNKLNNFSLNRKTKTVSIMVNGFIIAITYTQGIIVNNY